jgi:hypothetical protein
VAQRLPSLALSIVVLAVSGWGALAGSFFGFAMKCGDSCGTPPPWHEDPSAWQWEAFGWVAVGGLFAAFVFVIAVALRRTLGASLALGSWAVLAIVFLKLLADSGLTSHPVRGWLALGALVLVGVAAIGLARPRDEFTSARLT